MRREANFSCAVLYVNRTRVLDNIRIVLARPSMLIRNQRRKFARAELNVPATFEYVCSPHRSTERSGARSIQSSNILHGTVRDISGGGLRAHVGGVLGIREMDAVLDLFRPESTVRVRLPLPSLQRNAVLARVLSSARAATAGGLTIQLSCEFLPMAAWEQDIVNEHVLQFQKQQGHSVKLR